MRTGQYKMVPLNQFLTEYVERNTDSTYKAVAVGKYGIRTRESIYSKELTTDYSKYKVIYQDTLTVGMGSKQIDIGILSDNQTYCVSPAYHTYRIGGIDSNYLNYCLQQKNSEMFERFVRRGSRQGKTIEFKRWINYQIPVYSLEDQCAIVARLSKVEKIISNYQKEISLMDSLIKSRFVELFGDLKANNKKWPIVKFTDIASIDTRMIHSFDGYENYPHIGIDSIEKNTGKLSGFRTVKEDGVISGKYLFDERHIIYSKIRPNLNKVALPTFSGVCSADAYPILPNVELCTREFLAYVMRSDLFLDYILAFSNRTNLPKVNKMQVEGFECPLPALEQQKVFVELINQIDKSKLAQVMYRL